jgi:DNA-binding NarL/FixJ family response regulator
MEKIKILIVDDQNLFRQSLASLINSIEQFKLVGDFESGEALLKELPKLNKATSIIALIDLDMPGMNGIKLNDILIEQYPNVKVIILSVHINPLLITQMINARASAYLAKNCDKQELITAIQSVNKTGFYFNTDVVQAIQHSANHRAQAQKFLNSLPSKITEREIQVLQLICQQLSSAEIADKLFLSTRTIETHRNNLLTKTGCRNTAGLVLFAIKYNLFSPPL